MTFRIESANEAADLFTLAIIDDGRTVSDAHVFTLDELVALKHSLQNIFEKKPNDQSLMGGSKYKFIPQSSANVFLLSIRINEQFFKGYYLYMSDLQRLLNSINGVLNK